MIPFPHFRRALWIGFACYCLGLASIGTSVAQTGPLAIGSGPEPSAPYPDPVPLDFHHYYSNHELRDAFERLVRAYPELATLAVAGQSREGRDLYVVTLANRKGRALDRRPAMWIDANMHGNEIQGSEVCLHLAHYVLQRAGREAWIDDLLADRVLYLWPVVNPDSRERFFTQAMTPHSPRFNSRPFDEDGDLLVDEDGPEDLDGDGQILSMRVPDSLGTWRASERSGRLMDAAPTGERGLYRLIFSEGIDNDRDGRLNEDGLGGVDLNRNFPSAWTPQENGPRSGPYPLSEPETRSMAEFLLAHPAVAGIQSFHNNGNLILRPPAHSDDVGVPRSDIDAMDALGEAGQKILPDYRYVQTFKGLYPVQGGFLDWGYEQTGAWVFSNELWDAPDFDRKDGVSEQEALEFDDIVSGGRGFVEWKPFHHPQLGDIELGGWSQWSYRMPPRDYLPELCLRNTLFALFHARSLPLLRLHLASAERRADGGVTIALDVENQGIVPSMSGMARKNSVQAPDSLFLNLPKDVASLGGGISPVESATPEVQREPDAIELGSVPGLRRTRAVFDLSGPRGARVGVRVRGAKGGEDEISVVLP